MQDSLSKQGYDILNDALNSMQEALVVYGEDGCLLVCNQAFLNMYGYTEQEAAPGPISGYWAKSTYARVT